MLLELKDTSEEKVERLLEFARQNDINFNLLDDELNYFLPGKRLSDDELIASIEKGRNSPTISMEEAHQIIRDKLHARKVHE